MQIKKTTPPKTTKLIVISIVLGLLGGLLLIGIPGALFLQLIGLLYHFFGLTPLSLSGDSVWPIAIIISLLWPLPITPIFNLHYKHLPQRPVFQRWALSVLGSILITISVGFILLL